jgi:hypothetical protein
VAEGHGGGRGQADCRYKVTTADCASAAPNQNVDMAIEHVLDRAEHLGTDRPATDALQELSEHDDARGG